MNPINITVSLLGALLYLSVGLGFILSSESTQLSKLLRKVNARTRLAAAFFKALMVILWPYVLLMVSNANLKNYFADKYGSRFPLIGLFVSVVLLAKIVEVEGIDLWSFLVKRLYFGGFWDFLGNFYLIAVVSIAMAAFFAMGVEAFLWGDYL